MSVRGNFGRRSGTAALLFGAAALSSSTIAGGLHAQSAKLTVPNCVNATAILGGSTAGGNEEHFQKIIAHLKKEDRRWEVVAEAERMVTKKISLKRWSVRNPKQGGPDTVLTAQCGHGGTCNLVAQEVLRLFPQMSPGPEVHCGDTSNILENPTSVP